MDSSLGVTVLYLFCGYFTYASFDKMNHQSCTNKLKNFYFNRFKRNSFYFFQYLIKERKKQIKLQFKRNGPQTSICNIPLYSLCSPPGQNDFCQCDSYIICYVGTWNEYVGNSFSGWDKVAYGFFFGSHCIIFILRLFHILLIVSVLLNQIPEYRDNILFEQYFHVNHCQI